MQTKQMRHRRHHRYWPFNQYNECWWQHPHCHPPYLGWRGKPGAEEKEEELEDYNNLLDRLVHFARKIRKN
jgi:hypothetical protein